MDRTFTFQTHHTQFPTLQSIDAQSQISVDIRQQQLEHLSTKIFMLCLQLQRKHKIIQQLQSEAYKDEMKKSQIDITHRDLNGRYQKLTKQYHMSIQANGVLKNQVMNMEKIIADLEIHKARSAYNRELQDKVNILEIKLKQAEQQKIQFVERQKNLRRENSMLSFSANKTAQKNRIKDLQNQLAQEKSKLQLQKRLTAELKHQIQKSTNQIRQLREFQVLTIKKYQQRIQKIQITKQNQDLRQSQCTAANQQKLVLLSQQLNRLKQEIQYTRNLLREEKQKVTLKEFQISKLAININSFENQVKNYQINGSATQQQYKKREEQLLLQVQSYEKSIKNMKLTQTDLQSFLKQKINSQNQLKSEIQRLRSQLQIVETDKNKLKTEFRKMKRKSIEDGAGECEICKIRSSVTIFSGKNILENRKPMDLQEIIKETQKLNISNKKIQNLINHHQMTSQHSLQIRSNISRTVINTSQ